MDYNLAEAGMVFAGAAISTACYSMTAESPAAGAAVSATVFAATLQRLSSLPLLDRAEIISFFLLYWLFLLLNVPLVRRYRAVSKYAPVAVLVLVAASMTVALARCLCCDGGLPDFVAGVLFLVTSHTSRMSLVGGTADRGALEVLCDLRSPLALALAHSAWSWSCALRRAVPAYAALPSPPDAHVTALAPALAALAVAASRRDMRVWLQARAYTLWVAPCAALLLEPRGGLFARRGLSWVTPASRVTQLLSAGALLLACVILAGNARNGGKPVAPRVEEELSLRRTSLRMLRRARESVSRMKLPQPCRALYSVSAGEADEAEAVLRLARECPDDSFASGVTGASLARLAPGVSGGSLRADLVDRYFSLVASRSAARPGVLPLCVALPCSWLPAAAAATSAAPAAASSAAAAFPSLPPSPRTAAAAAAGNGTSFVGRVRASSTSELISESRRRVWQEIESVRVACTQFGRSSAPCAAKTLALPAGAAVVLAPAQLCGERWALAVADVRGRRLELYDPVGCGCGGISYTAEGRCARCEDERRKVLAALRRALSGEGRDAMSWAERIVEPGVDAPAAADARGEADSGVLVCKYAECAAARGCCLGPVLSRQDVDAVRSSMVLELLGDELLL